MPFRLYSSANPENLASHFSHALLESFRQTEAKEQIIVVPNHRTAQWLTRRIALELGICMHLKPVYLDTLLQSFQAQETDAIPLWTLDLFEAFQQKKLQPFAQDNDIEPTSHLELASRVSSMLHQYARIRTDWFFNTPNSIPFDALLLKSMQILREKQHLEADPVLAAYKACHQQTNGGPEPLPATVFLFGFWELPPVYWTLLEQLYPDTTFELYFTLPSRTFLVDLGKDTGDSKYHLLSKLIQRGRQFQSFILDQENETVDLDEQKSQEPKYGLLGTLKKLLHDPDALTDEHRPHLERDASLQVHSCHHPRRELETIKHCIQEAMEADKTLRLEDIHVYAPDLQEYKKWIPLVFGSDGDPASRLEWCVVTDGEVETEAVFAVMFEALELIGGSWSLPRLQSLLHSEPIRMLHGAGTESSAKFISTLDRFGAFSGYSNAETDPTALHFQWQQGLDRLLANYLEEDATPDTGSQRSYWNSLTREETERLVEILLPLRDAAERVRGSQSTFQRWIELARDALQWFVPEPYHPAAQAAWKDALHQLECLCRDRQAIPCNAAMLRQMLRRMLPNFSSGGLLERRSGIQFSSIRYQNLSPASVVCVLGLQDGSFPRSRSKSSFDLIQSSEPLPGDPSPKEEDAYWLLQSLMLCKQRWIATYLGGNTLNQEIRFPSYLLQAICDCVQNTLPQFFDDGEETSSFATVIHPRFAYDPVTPASTPQRKIYSATRHVVMQTLCKSDPPLSFLAPAPSTSTDSQSGDCVDFYELVRFLTHPAKYYCQSVLGIKIDHSESEIREHEPFFWDNDALKQFKLRQIALEHTSCGGDASSMESRLASDHLIPQGYAGSQLNAALWHHWMHALAQQINEHSVILSEKHLSPAEIMIGELRFSFPCLTALCSEVILLHPSSPRAKHEIEAWLFAMLLPLRPGQAGKEQPQVLLASKDQVQRFVPQEDAEAILSKLLGWWVSHQNEFFPFFPEIGAVAAKQNVEDAAVLLEHSKWTSSYDASRGEMFDPHVQCVLRGIQQPFDKRFFEISRTLYTHLNAWKEKG